MTTTAIKPVAAAPSIDSVLIEGDLSRLTPDQKLSYYMKVCESLGLNPYTKPFDYLRLNGKEILYARKDATDQLRKAQHVSIVGLTRERLDDLYVVTASARTADGRSDSAIGAVMVKGLVGEGLANALMKAETKAKRRVTLSICGLGMTDDTEVDSIPGAQRVKFNGPIYTPDEMGALIEVDGRVVNVDSGEVMPDDDYYTAPRAREDVPDTTERRGLTDMEEAHQSWREACVEADRLKVAHKPLPQNAPLDQVQKWTITLLERIAQMTPPTAAETEAEAF